MKLSRGLTSDTAKKRRTVSRPGRVARRGTRGDEGRDGVAIIGDLLVGGRGEVRRRERRR